MTFAPSSVTSSAPLSEPQALARPVLAPPSLSPHQQVGFELGWDHAHHGLVPPAPYAQEPSALHDGLRAGQAVFGLRTLPADRHVRRWLQLRLHAWLRGRAVELVQVTPNYLKQIEATHCPITRQPLIVAALHGNGTSIDRVRNDAAYAAGNLAVMSAKANQAKGAHDRAQALAMAARIEADGLDGLQGLTAAQWRRVATLCSFVEPMAHATACRVPMVVLPPNRLRLFNPVQALQAFISRQLLSPGWSHRLSRFEDLLPGQAAKRAFQTFFHALLPRVLEVGRAATPQALRWAVEDAWGNALAQQRWAAFAGQLTAAQCEALVTRAAARRLATVHVQPLGDAQATDGWALDDQGYVPRSPLPPRPAVRRRAPRAAEPSLAMPPLRVPVQAHLPLQ